MTNLSALPGGTELVNDYRIDRVLGAGGFGITYLAHEVALERAVTIKEYFPTDYAARADTNTAAPRSKECANDYRWGLERFIEEAQTLAKFNHPNIVRVYRYFKANNTGYMVLHFEEGQSFKNWLKGLGRAPRQKELDAILEPLLDALDLIHRQDFLHRDIAPDNIIIRKDGSPVLIDFGSARGDIAAQSKTVSALVKPGYSPYEQYAETSRQQGPWTDIYALGATLYHASTGKRPPDAPSRMVNDEYRTARNAALSAYRPRFLRAIDAALSLNVEDRPQSIGAWRGELLAPESKPEKPERTRKGWFTRRWEQASQKPATPSQPGEAEAPTPTLALTPDATSPIPPPPDAPGPKGGMVQFMEGLKKRRGKPASLAEALARVGSAQDGEIAGTPPPITDHTGTPALDASPHARTMKFTPRGAQAARSADAASQTAAEGAAGGPTTPPPLPPASSNDAKPKQRKKQRRDAKRKPQPKRARALVQREQKQRKPARPKPMRANSGNGSWSSFVGKVVIGAGIAGIVIASQDKLPRLDTTAMFENLSNAWTTASQTSTDRKASPRETAAIQKHRPAAPTASPSRAANDRKRPAVTPPPATPLIQQTTAHAKAATAMAYTADGETLVTVGKDHSLKIWSAAKGKLLRTITLHEAPATAVAVQKPLVATGHEDGRIEVFDLTTGTKTASMQRNEAAVWSLAFTNEAGRIAAASHDWTITLWDVRQPAAPVHILEGHKNAVQALASTPGKPLLATGGADRQVRLWNLDTLELVRTYPKQRDFITAIAFSPDGTMFASSTLKGDIRIWSTKRRRLLKRLRGHKGAVEGLSFSPDGRLLASAGADGTVRLWNVKRGRTLKTLASHAGTVTAVSFAPNGERFASVGDDGRIRIWSTDTARGIR